MLAQSWRDIRDRLGGSCGRLEISRRIWSSCERLPIDLLERWPLASVVLRARACSVTDTRLGASSLARFTVLDRFFLDCCVAASIVRGVYAACNGLTCTEGSSSIRSAFRSVGSRLYTSSTSEPEGGRIVNSSLESALRPSLLCVERRVRSSHCLRLSFD